MVPRLSHVFFLLWVCFSFVPHAVVLVLVPVPSREASFFFISFPPAVEAARPRPERCTLLLWFLEQSVDVDVSSSSCCWLIRASFLSQINTDTPAGQQEPASTSCPPPLHQIPTHYHDASELLTHPRANCVTQTIKFIDLWTNSSDVLMAV